MGADLYQCNLKLKENEKKEEVVKQANVIFQKKKRCSESQLTMEVQLGKVRGIRRSSAWPWCSSP